MFSLLLATLSAQGTLTLPSRVSTVEALLKDVSKRTGVAMEATAQTKDEIVLVGVKQITPEAFREQLAPVVGAVWRKENGRFILSRPAELTSTQAQEERALNVQLVSDGVARLKKQIAEQPTFDETAAENLSRRVRDLYTKYQGRLSDADGLQAAIALEPESPAGRLAIAAVGTLGIQQIADVGPGDRIVYSTNPTGIQRKLPHDLTRVIQRYVAEQTTYVAALKRVPMSEDWANSWSPLLNREVPKAPAGVLLATARSPYNDALSVDVKLFDSKGSYVGEHRTLLRLDKGTRQEALAEGKVALSPRSTRFMSAIRQLQGGNTFVQDSELLKELENPESHDPLSYVPADGVAALAKNRNVMVCLPDEAFLIPAFMAVDPDGKLDLKKFSGWFGENMTLHPTDAWFAAWPKRRITAREMRVDRRVLGNFFRNARRSDGASLDAMAEFAAKLPRRYTATLVPLYAFFLLPDLNAGLTDRSVEMLRVYGRLNLDQRKALQEGNPIAVQQLSAPSVADLNDLVFRADSPVSISHSEPPPADGVWRGGLSTEVTHALPRGVPASATFTMSGQLSDAVIPDGGGSDGADYRPLTAWALAYHMVQAENANPNDRRKPANYTRFRFGKTRNIEFTLELSPAVSTRAEVAENRFPRNAASVPFESLPESFRKAVGDAKVQVKKDHFSPSKIPPP